LDQSPATVCALSQKDCARDLLEASAGILLDWDGSVAFANAPHRDGVAFIKRYKGQIAIVSNSSTLRPQAICKALARTGIDFPVERVVLAGYETLRLVAKLNQRTMVFGTRHMLTLAQELGIHQVRRAPQLIVLMRDTRFSYSKLQIGVNALMGGAKLIVSNLDLSHPGAAASIVPETGALLAAFKACLPPDRFQMETIGKPGPILFQVACQALGLIPSQVVMIGDNRVTDIAGAQLLGMRSILVSPGSELSLGDLC
jgi:HAD superfamily hydrolase (TIGR01450 family)